MTVDGKMYLSSDEPIGEYIRLFCGFAILENLRCRPSATVNDYGSPVEICFTSGYEFSEPDVGEAGVALGVQKDVFLDPLVRPARNATVLNGDLPVSGSRGLLHKSGDTPVREQYRSTST